LEFDPNNSDAYVGRGAAFANQKKYDIAISEFKKALKLNPNDTTAQRYLKAIEEKVC